MSDDDSTIKITSDLAKLEHFVDSNAFKFKGLSKKIIETADATSNAGKAWTTFSRLSSGTPIWAAQNKIRAYLEILGGFEKRSVENTEALAKQREEVMSQVRVYNELTANVEEFQHIINNTKPVGMDLEEFTEMKERIEATIESTDTYQKMLLMTGDAEFARSKAIDKMKQSQEEALKAKQKFTKELQNEYAFDTRRIKQARELAEAKAKEQGLSKKEIKRAGDTATKKARATIRSQQKSSFRDTLEMGDELRTKLTDIAKPLVFLKGIATPIETTSNLLFKMESAGRKFQKRSMEFTNRLQPIVSMAFKYFVAAILVIGAIFLLVAYAKEFASQFEQFGILDDLKKYGEALLIFGKSIIDTVMTFVNSGFDEGLAKLSPLLDQALDLILDGMEILIKVGWVAILSGLQLLVDFVGRMFDDPKFRETVFSVLLKVGKIILIAFFVKYLVSQALLLIGIYALPIMIGVVIIAGMYAVAKYLTEKYQDQFDNLANFLMTPFKFWTTVLKGIRDYFEWAVNTIRDFLSGNGGVRKAIMGRASGGMINNSNSTIVGENGPELVKLPQGSRVFNHQVTKNMTSGTTINNYFTINAKDTSDREMKRIADKLSGMINQKINRSANSRMYG